MKIIFFFWLQMTRKRLSAKNRSWLNREGRKPAFRGRLKSLTKRWRDWRNTSTPMLNNSHVMMMYIFTLSFYNKYRNCYQLLLLVDIRYMCIIQRHWHLRFRWCGSGNVTFRFFTSTELSKFILKANKSLHYTVNYIGENT